MARHHLTVRPKTRVTRSTQREAEIRITTGIQAGTRANIATTSGGHNGSKNEKRPDHIGTFFLFGMKIYACSSRARYWRASAA
jgi:hypothetical protein